MNIIKLIKAWLNKPASGGVIRHNLPDHQCIGCEQAALQVEKGAPQAKCWICGCTILNPQYIDKKPQTNLTGKNTWKELQLPQDFL